MASGQPPGKSLNRNALSKSRLSFREREYNPGLGFGPLGFPSLKQIMMALNPRQRRFVAEYLIDLNGVFLTKPITSAIDFSTETYKCPCVGSFDGIPAAKAMGSM
jgi:hypothetical protein